MLDDFPLVRRYWCKICGKAKDDLVVPYCRHGVIDPPCPMEEMEEIPSWHPLADMNEKIG